MPAATQPTLLPLTRHRRLTVLSGDPADIHVHARTCINANERVAMLTRDVSSVDRYRDGLLTPALTAVPPTSIRAYLGTEFDTVLVDAGRELDIDGIAAMAGTVVGGGQLILLTPALSSWQRQSLFLERFVATLKHHTTADITQAAGIRARHSQPGAIPAAADPLTQQRKIISDLLGIWHKSSHHNSVTLLTADRGRGKSTALGLFLAELLNTRQPPTVMVSAPSRRAADVLFHHFTTHSTSANTARVRFCPPEELLLHHADLLLIDEAATVPLSTLRVAAHHYPRVVLSSTTHGYEGAGRGFALRLTQLLELDDHEVLALSMDQPIRWLPGDPIEAFCHQALLLDAPLPTLQTPLFTTRDALHHECIPQSTLAANEALLQAVYGLLIQAHYRTTPADLQHMLDGEGLHIHLMFHRDELLAAALVVLERPFHELSIRQSILARQRRPSGRLLPQLLAQYTMMAGALDLHCARIVRIAVHPKRQAMGIGSQLLHTLAEFYCHEQQDILGAMFSAVPETVRFWHKNAYASLHLGFRRHASSGHRPLTVGKILTTPATDAKDTALAVLNRAQLLYADTEQFHRREPADPPDPIRQSDLGAHCLDVEILRRFVNGTRAFNDCHAALARIAERLAIQPDRWLESVGLSNATTELLLHCRSPQMSIKQLTLDNDSPSKAETERRLRSAVKGTLRQLENTLL